MIVRLWLHKNERGGRANPCPPMRPEDKERAEFVGRQENTKGRWHLSRKDVRGSYFGSYRPTNR